MMVNHDIAFTSLATFLFDVPTAQVAEVRQETSETLPVQDDSPGIAGLQLSFDSGEGRLFIFPSI